MTNSVYYPLLDESIDSTFELSGIPNPIHIVLLVSLSVLLSIKSYIIYMIVYLDNGLNSENWLVGGCTPH